MIKGKVLLVIMALILSSVSAESIPQTTGAKGTDINGRSYDLDGLLNSGKVVVVHWTFST